MVAPTWGLLRVSPPFLILHHYPYCFQNVGTSATIFFTNQGQWRKLKIEVEIIVRLQVEFMQLHLTIQPFEERHYTSEC